MSKTVGQASSELLEKQPETLSPIEQMRENLSDYEKNVFECLKHGIKTYPGDFFITVLTKRERLMPNVLRNYFFHRATCPTPDYDQAVYHYKRDHDSLEFLWVIPSRDASIHLKDNALTVDKSERMLLNFVLEFAAGSLYKLAKKLNGEEE